MQTEVLGPRGLRTWRGDENGAGIVAEAHARYYESVVRGNTFGVANQSGITTQAGLSLTTPALTLYNPAGSGVNGLLIYAGCVETVASAAAQIVWIGANTNIAAAAVTGTLTTAHRNMVLGNGSQPRLQPLLAATLPAAPVAIATLGEFGTVAITSWAGSATLGREFAGSIIIGPGAAISFQTSTASGSSGFFGEFIWEEILIP